MKQHAKIQVGNTFHDVTLDAHIYAMDALPRNLSAENKPPEPEVVQLFRSFIGQFPTWPVTNGFSDAQVVEGSISEPITDEGRLPK